MVTSWYARSRSWVLVACVAALAGCPAPDPSTDGGADVAPADVANDTSRLDAVDTAANDAADSNSSDAVDTGSDAPVPGDEDGDRHAAASAGGDDCDDADPNRYPGNAEVCDSTGHDEDCDANTFGTRDEDHDSYVDSVCCNTDRSGTMYCGNDCNDSNPSVHPAQTDVCNGIDDNCNGMIDEGVSQIFYPDADGDGFGDAAGTAMYACLPPGGYVSNHTDCDDAQAAVHPGALEVCDPASVDEDCDGVPNEGCACTGGSTRPCAMSGACALGTQTCIAGTFGPCSVVPTGETCNGIDDDCDGMTDEDPTLCPSGSTCSGGMCR